jgi:hypothetical protein
VDEVIDLALDAAEAAADAPAAYFEAKPQRAVSFKSCRGSGSRKRTTRGIRDP